MASSFINQIAIIIHVVQKLKPKTILDIGKGFGKYGFLLHEYYGIDNTKKLNSLKPLKDQSNLIVDAVEVDPDLMLPHLADIYNKVFFGDILHLYKDLPFYDVVLMIDIIEHIDKEKALLLLKHLLDQDTKVIVATPITFFKQDLYESEFEHHISYWTKSDFKNIGYVDVQYLDAGAVYLLTKEKIDLRGFGEGLIKKIRRVARAVKNEF